MIGWLVGRLTHINSESRQNTATDAGSRARIITHIGTRKVGGLGWLETGRRWSRVELTGWSDRIGLTNYLDDLLADQVDTDLEVLLTNCLID